MESYHVNHPKISTRITQLRGAHVQGGASHFEQASQSDLN